MDEKFLSPEEVAEIAHVKKATVWGWLRTGKLNGIKTGKKYLILESVVHDFLGGVASSKVSKEENFEDITESDKPNKYSSNEEWGVYGRKLFKQMRAEGLEHFFSTGQVNFHESHKVYHYKGETFCVYSDRITILREAEFVAEDSDDSLGFDMYVDVVLFRANFTE